MVYIDSKSSGVSGFEFSTFNNRIRAAKDCGDEEKIGNLNVVFGGCPLSIEPRYFIFQILFKSLSVDRGPWAWPLLRGQILVDNVVVVNGYGNLNPVFF